jgi:hypothetical protein
MPVPPILPLLPLVALFAAVVGGQAALACGDGTPLLVGRIAALTLPDGSGRPTVTLTDVRPASDGDGAPNAAPLAAVATIALDGILVPQRVADAAKAAAAMLVFDDETATFLPSTEAPDRHGRRHGLIRLADGDGLAERLITAGVGLADVAMQPCAVTFLAAEAPARAERRGIWRQSRLWTELNSKVAALPDHIIGRGRVSSVGRSGRTTYINFGGDFRTDATVRLTDSVATALAASGIAPETLAGRRIEVRGWATERDGLDLQLVAPDALRLVDAATDRRTD